MRGSSNTFQKTKHIERIVNEIISGLSCRQGERAVRGRPVFWSCWEGWSVTDLQEEAKLRESICRYGRSLFERGLTPGSSGNISLSLDDGGWLVTPTNASLGFLDPARLSRLDAQWKADQWRPADQGDSAARALYESRGMRRGPSCICIRPIRSRCRCCRTSTPGGVAAAHRLLSDARRQCRSGAVLPSGRSGGRGCDPWPGRAPRGGAVGQSRPGGGGRNRWRPRCSPPRSWRKQRNYICFCAT